MALKLTKLRSSLLTSRAANRPIQVIFSHGKKTKNNDDMWNELVGSYESKTKLNSDQTPVSKSKATVKTNEINISNATTQVQASVQRDWFTTLTKNSVPETKKQLKTKSTREKLSECKTPDEKRALIESMLLILTGADLTLPTNLTEDEWKLLLMASSFSQVKSFLVKIAKERHYKELKAEKREQTLEMQKERQALIDAGLLNISENNLIHRRITTKDIRLKARSHLMSAIINKNPSVVFDFRYEHYFHRPNLIPSLYRQYIEIVSKNRQEINFEVT